MSMQKLPTFFISHGGGPWPWMPDMREHFRETEKWLIKIGEEFKPKSILSISGHWEENQFEVATSPLPSMLYDYSGFPAHTYSVKYSAPGSIELALRVKALLVSAGIHVDENPQRGFDHGTFVPLSLMYPAADIPVGQLSLKRGLDPALHLKVGELLQGLRNEGVMLIGSGLSYHNLGAFFQGGEKASAIFEEWLTMAVTSSPLERKELLINWEKAPEARMAHPREEHLIPLMVVAGAAGTDSGKRLFIDRAFGVTMASYQFG